MTEKASKIYRNIQTKFTDIISQNHLDLSSITIHSRGLSAEEAIGKTERKDYPILTGSEVMLQAEYKGAFGQAFTDAPSDYSGSLKNILEMDIIHDPHARGVYIASLNAVLRYLGLIENTVHCRNAEPPECAREYVLWLSERFPAGTHIALIGYQPSLFEAISKEDHFDLKVLDLNPENVGQIRFGVRVGHGIDDYGDTVLKWADLVLCTGSVFCNGTMDRYVDIDKNVLFFGITGAGACYLLGLDRHCPKSA